ncbi:MAG: hypothetical protein ACXACY_30370, partial [Candidatus Hodarchaeales archaeon]
LMIMFVICFVYLLINRALKRDLHPIIHFKILLFSLIPILPWMKIGPSIPPEWSHLTTVEGLSIVISMVQSQISLIILILMIISFVFILITRRDHLSLLFGLSFIAYYLLFTIMRFGEWNHRYMIALYPSIAVFLSLFVSRIAKKTRWKHAFTLLSLILTFYLVFISIVPRSFSNLTTWRYRDFETQYFAVDKATDWIKNETDRDAKILVLYLISYKLYLERIYPDRKDIGQKEFIFRDPGYDVKKIIYPLQNLRKYCEEHNISYIMFPYGPNNLLPNARPLVETMEMTRYLFENMDDYYEKMATFSFDDNFILIYKVK